MYRLIDPNSAFIMTDHNLNISYKTQKSNDKLSKLPQKPQLSLHFSQVLSIQRMAEINGAGNSGEADEMCSSLKLLSEFDFKKIYGF